MTVTSQDREIVQSNFDAMMMGLAGEEKMMALFADSATMSEPFNDGQTTVSEGKEAIRRRFLQLWTGEGPHDLALTVDQINASDGKLVVDWTCRSGAFPTPMHGVDYFTVRDGLIHEMVMEVTTWPDFGGEGHG